VKGGVDSVVKRRRRSSYGVGDADAEAAKSTTTGTEPTSDVISNIARITSLPSVENRIKSLRQAVRDSQHPLYPLALSNVMQKHCDEGDGGREKSAVKYAMLAVTRLVRGDEREGGSMDVTMECRAALYRKLMRT